MSRRGELDAIVVGAGAIGAALALALARDGLEVALIEAREPRPWRADDEVDLRVVALAPDARDLLADLGVWPSIAAARASAYRRMRVWDAHAPGQLDFDSADQGQAALGWIVENRLIQHLLWQAIGGERRVRMLCPMQVTAIENAGSRVTADLSDCTRLHANLLVVAEGADSSLREMLGIAVRGRDYGQRAVVAHVGTERPHEQTAWQRFQPGGPLALLPLADGRSSIVWSRPEADAARILALPDAAFRAELGSAFDFRLGMITDATPRVAFPLRMRLAERYVAGRCVLVGDAAHVVHPLAGQGMNLGFRDVRTLRDVLCAARERGSDIGAVQTLRRYERERRSENVIAARALDAIERLFDSKNIIVAMSRGIALSGASRLAPVKRALAVLASGR